MRERILSKLNSIIITLLFSITIFVPFFMGIIEKDKDISVIEKRKLSKLPQIGGNINDIEKFPKLFDKYYSDHFGLRDWFTKYYKLVKFNLGDSPSKNVVVGKDGWLFLGPINKRHNSTHSDPIGDVRNVNLYSKGDLEKLALYMVSLKKWLKDKGVEYILVIAPNKHTIYFDKLPDYISKANEYSSTDQLVEYLKSYTNVPVVDLRKTLIENKKKYQLYYKTDTHWNNFGANIAQYEIMLEIEKLFPKLINPEIMKIKEGIRGKSGDLARMIGINDLNESRPQPIFENSCKPVKYPKDATGKEPHSYNCEGQKLNTVIFYDSFFVALKSYFARKFKSSTYVWGKLDYSSLKKYVSSENPDIIIEEWVERSLPFVPKISPELNRLFNKKLFKKLPPVPNIAPELTHLFNKKNKKLFECSDKSIFFNNFSQLIHNKHIKYMGDINQSIKMQSIGIDPIIYFPPLPLKGRIQYIVHIEVESSDNSTLQLFYTDNEVEGYPWSEKNSVKAGVTSGANDIYISLDYDRLGTLLRLDPVAGIGEVDIKTIEVREIKNSCQKNELE